MKAGLIISAGVIAVIVLVWRAGISDIERKILFYGGAVAAFGLKAAGWVTALPWYLAPVLALIGILTEPSATASAQLDQITPGV